MNIRIEDEKTEQSEMSIEPLENAIINFYLSENMDILSLMICDAPHISISDLNRIDEFDVRDDKNDNNIVCIVDPNFTYWNYIIDVRPDVREKYQYTMQRACGKCGAFSTFRTDAYPTEDLLVCPSCSSDSRNAVHTVCVYEYICIDDQLVEIPVLDKKSISSDVPLTDIADGVTIREMDESCRYICTLRISAEKYMVLLSSLNGNYRFLVTDHIPEDKDLLLCTTTYSKTYAELYLELCQNEVFRNKTIGIVENDEELYNKFYKDRLMKRLLCEDSTDNGFHIMTLFNNAEYADVKLECYNKHKECVTISANWCILAPQSDYFKTLMKTECKNDKEKSGIWSLNISAESLTEIVRWLYNRTIIVENLDSINEFYRAVDQILLTEKMKHLLEI